MERCEALIVGGGPAGSTLARQLVRAGRDVVVLDKASFPRDKTCAGWITPPVLGELDLEPHEYAREGRTLQPIEGFRVGLIGAGRDEASLIRYAGPVSYGILRRELDTFLLERSGARLILGAALESVERRSTWWIVNGEIEARLLVGAGGHFCPVARHLMSQLGGVRASGKEPIVVAQELERRLDGGMAETCRVAADVPELYFSADLKGYGWCFRKGDHLNVGLGRLEGQALPGQVRSFVDWLEETQRLPRGFEGRYKGHAYLLYGTGQRPLVADGALLIGDAAGLAYAGSGEGIRPAVESALLAAQVVSELSSFERTDLIPYQQRLEAHFGVPGARVSRFIPSRLKEQLARSLFRTTRFRRWAVDHLFLRSNQPPIQSLEIAA